MSELALLGGSKAKQKSFPVWPQYDDNERRALQEVLESRVWWRTPGTKTLEFEKAFAKLSRCSPRNRRHQRYGRAGSRDGRARHRSR